MCPMQESKEKIQRDSAWIPGISIHTDQGNASDRLRSCVAIEGRRVKEVHPCMERGMNSPDASVLVHRLQVMKSQVTPYPYSIKHTV